MRMFLVCLCAISNPNVGKDYVYLVTTASILQKEMDKNKDRSHPIDWGVEKHHCCCLGREQSWAPQHPLQHLDHSDGPSLAGKSLWRQLSRRKSSHNNMAKRRNMRSITQQKRSASSENTEMMVNHRWRSAGSNDDER